MQATNMIGRFGIFPIRPDMMSRGFSNLTTSRAKKLAYFGSDEFSVLVLKKILGDAIAVKRDQLLIFSTGKPENEQRLGRKNEFIKFAEKEDLPVWIPVSSNIKEERIKQWREFHARLDSYCKENDKFDLGIVCSYGNLIPSYLIEYFKGVVY